METITPPTIDGPGILRARTALGMSQPQFAKALGDLAPNTIYRWEAGWSIQSAGMVARAVRDLEAEAAAVETLAVLLEPYVEEALEAEEPRRVTVKPEALAARKAELERREILEAEHEAELAGY